VWRYALAEQQDPLLVRLLLAIEAQHCLEVVT
jgi:hypothetical protein